MAWSESQSPPHTSSHTLRFGFHLCSRCLALQASLHPLAELLLQLLLPELPELPLVNGITLPGGGQTAANQVNHKGPSLKKHTNQLVSKAGVEATKARLEGAEEEREGT